MLSKNANTADKHDTKASRWFSGFTSAVKEKLKGNLNDNINKHMIYMGEIKAK